MEVFFSVIQNWPATISVGQFFTNLPVFLMSPPSSQFWVIARVIGATIFVSLLAYYVLKLMGGARARQYKRSSGNLQLIDSISIGIGSSIQIVKAGEKYLVISVTKERVTLLTEVENLELSEETENFDPSKLPFGKILQKFLKPKDGDSTGDES